VELSELRRQPRHLRMAPLYHRLRSSTSSRARGIGDAARRPWSDRAPVARPRPDRLAAYVPLSPPSAPAVRQPVEARRTGRAGVERGIIEPNRTLARLLAPGSNPQPRPAQPGSGMRRVRAGRTGRRAPPRDYSLCPGFPRLSPFFPPRPRLPTCGEQELVAGSTTAGSDREGEDRSHR
jgi:hypothetical protein